MNDLFDDEAIVRKPPSRSTQPKGYAAPPGTGPAGHTCRDCKHKVGEGSRYLKCGLMRPYWTHGIKTDIRAKWPACAKWEARKS